MKLNTEDIKSFIPHRPPFLYVDSVREYVKGESIIGIKKFTADEYFFKGHFPGNPIVPGVILMESLAQTGGILVNISFRDELEEKGYSNAFLMGLDQCKFRKIVQPGDQVELHVNLEKKRSRILYFNGQVLVGETKIAEGKISASLV